MPPVTLTALPRRISHPTSPWRSTRLGLLALPVLPLLLAGCGGGVYVGVGYEWSDYSYGGIDQPPAVSLAAGASVAAPGSAVRLVAAASDDYAVREVGFYLRDARGDILLATDRGPPWEITTTVPLNAVAVVTYVARAVDDAGQVSAPALTSVQVVGP